jgi:hypothetical protein
MFSLWLAVKLDEAFVAPHALAFATVEDQAEYSSVSH